MTRRISDLTLLPWRMGAAPRQAAGATLRDDRNAVSEWLPARVPGDVRADLIAAGRIPAVDSLEGIAAGGWVDDCDWWYRVEFPGGVAPDEALILEADGVDYQSAIWLDDVLLTTHAGSFGRQAIPLPVGPGASGSHELAIRIWGGGALPRLPNAAGRRLTRRFLDRVSAGVEYFPDRMATTKAQFSFGWDFSPRLLSAGIWDDLRLIHVRNAYIEDIQVCPEPLHGGDPAPVVWRIRLRVTRLRPCAVRAEISIGPENFEAGGSYAGGRIVQLCPNDAPLCTDDYDLVVKMASARRWWPWDQGEPCLYRVTVRLLDGRETLDEITQVCGVRQAERKALPGGAPWSFEINGRPVFLRGANWVPADILPGRVTDETYARLLAQARAAGVNFLRIWGGGVREKRAFWEACDRLGVMAWQEFPLACAFLDHYPRDARYLDLLEAEARGTVRLLRNHPSLLAWCGGNELSPEREAAPLERLAGVVREEDPDRPWIRASPSDGDVHQWAVWHGYADWGTLAEVRAPFLSEFGMQALPCAESVVEMYGDGHPVSPADVRWESRLGQPAKLGFYAGDAADLPAAITQTQRVQAVALQTGIEACRLRRVSLDGADVVDRCGGVAFWQFNEPWPAVSWSVIDHRGRPKAAYVMLQQSYQPLLVAARFARPRANTGAPLPVELWVVNDTPAGHRGCCAEARLDGQIVWSASGLDVRPGAATQIGTVEVTSGSPPIYLELALFSAAGERLSENRYDLGAPHPTRPAPRLRALLYTYGMRLIGG